MKRVCGQSRAPVSLRRQAWKSTRPGSRRCGMQGEARPARKRETHFSARIGEPAQRTTTAGYHYTAAEAKESWDRGGSTGRGYVKTTYHYLRCRVYAAGHTGGQERLPGRRRRQRRGGRPLKTAYGQAVQKQQKAGRLTGFCCEKKEKKKVLERVSMHVLLTALAVISNLIV